MWFAWKFVPLWYQQQPCAHGCKYCYGCDLLENSYLCGISNNKWSKYRWYRCVVICLKIRTFVVSATTEMLTIIACFLLWFAWKFVPLWYQQQPMRHVEHLISSCDLLENSYLCGISNNSILLDTFSYVVVICLKIRTFVVSATTEEALSLNPKELWFAWKFVPLWYQQQPHCQHQLHRQRCDLLENSYLCGISNNRTEEGYTSFKLWFAWKFVPLWYQQQHVPQAPRLRARCDLLENSYLCGISNNLMRDKFSSWSVVICLKIRTFVVSATTYH